MNTRPKKPVRASHQDSSFPQSLRRDDYMSPRQVAWFRDRVERDHANATARLNALRAESAEVLVASTADEADRASVEESAANCKAEIATLDRLIKACEAALGRVDSGEYGYCTETGEPIGLDRLIALPTASRCIVAAERAERRSAQYAHPV